MGLLKISKAAANIAVNLVISLRGETVDATLTPNPICTIFGFIYDVRTKTTKVSREKIVFKCR